MLSGRYASMFPFIQADEKAAKAAAAAAAKLAADPDRAARVARRQHLATKAELDQQMVLVEEEVALRGNEPQQGDTVRGTRSQTRGLLICLCGSTSDCTYLTCLAVLCREPVCTSHADARCA